MPNTVPNYDHCRRTVSAIAQLPILAASRAKQIIAIASILLITTTSFAQDQTTSSAPPADSAGVAPIQAEFVTVPASTRLALVLTNPVSTNAMHRGDVVYAQTTAPVIVGDRTVIPAGIFVQGKIEKLTRNGSRAESSHHAEHQPGRHDAYTEYTKRIGDRKHGWFGCRWRGVVGYIAEQSPLFCRRGLAYGDDIAAASDTVREPDSRCGSTSSGTSSRRADGRSAPLALPIL
jgi:hypothetical protein